MGLFINKTWQFKVAGIEGDVILFGVNIFDYEWQDTHESVKVRDPQYDQEFKFNIYTVTIDGRERTFAAGEFSNLVYGFYTLEY